MADEERLGVCGLLFRFIFYVRPEDRLQDQLDKLSKPHPKKFVFEGKDRFYPGMLNQIIYEKRTEF